MISQIELPRAASNAQKSQPDTVYDSQEDSGEDLFDHETIATMPLSRQQVPFKDLPTDFSSPLQHTTQPTQILQPLNSEEPPSSPTVQVPASSPLHVSPVVQRSQAPPSRPNFAPPGTMLRKPVIPRPAPVSSFSDDDPPMVRSTPSDDDDELPDPDIKPTKFSHGSRNGLPPQEDFKTLTLQFEYKASSSGTENASNGKPQMSVKRVADDSASAYGSSRRPAKLPRQTGPARAQPIEDEDVTLEDLDPLTKRGVKDMQAVMPGRKLSFYRRILEKSRNNISDAVDRMFQEDSKASAVDLTAASSDDELQIMSTTKMVPTAKRQVNEDRSIQAKWSSTQARQRAPQKQSPSIPHESEQLPRKRIINRARRRPSTSPAPVDDDDDIVISEHPPRPTSGSGVKESITKPAKALVIDDEDSDSAIGRDEYRGELDGSDPEKELLKILNTGNVEDLADLSNQPEDIAALIVEQRPFRSLAQVRKVCEPSGTSKGRRQRKPIGEKIVEVALEMLVGFNAVDKLVKECESLEKPVKALMKKLKILEDDDAGELSLTTFDNLPGKSNHDSGIGTPSSSLPVEDENEFFVSDEDKAGMARLSQPAMMNKGKELKMKDYQLTGLTWMNFLYDQRMSGILADDMGLGKTCQVIAFLSHLKERNISGPHLVIVPGSTLENWLRELKRFSPDLYVEPYYGSQSERVMQRATIEDNKDLVDVVVTTYDMAKGRSSFTGDADAPFLRKLKPVVTVYDEGHMLRNQNNKLYQTLMRIPSRFRLLLTGTPLQNNLQELISLLAFIMPRLFEEPQEDLKYIFKYKAKTVDDDHKALLSAKRIARARSMITPFVLRRKKAQVLDLPAKTRRIHQCELIPGAHRDIYIREFAEGSSELEQAAGSKKTSKKRAGPMMNLRLAAIHPLLFRRLYDDKKLKKIIQIAKNHGLVEGNDDRIWEEYAKMGDYALHKYCWENHHILGDYELNNDEWMDSGKVKALCELLRKFKANGDRTLIFSQFTMVMDLLERVLADLEMPFHRLDGGTPISNRLAMVDEFCEDETIPVFMLSTRAGGTGINLAAANKVIIFDSSFNPQDDIQAENRAHRVGQTREVEVIRLITKDTIEEQIYALGESKLMLDERVAGDLTGEPTENAKIEALGEQQVREMMAEKLKKAKDGDVKDEFLDGLKAAGLDMSAA
ncbi:MAG: hypothetical protein M1820_007245 [Bogoriella megaspora]|nr:MAG: hypothetical protein M1820_007245 [Bogoriella megaspora]